MVRTSFLGVGDRETEEQGLQGSHSARDRSSLLILSLGFPLLHFPPTPRPLPQDITAMPPSGSPQL